jgi:hypothetical protein
MPPFRTLIGDDLAYQSTEVNMDRLKLPAKRAITPDDDEYQLPIVITGSMDFSEDEAEIIRLMGEHEPNTMIRAGDIVKLKRVNFYVRNRFKDQRRRIPLYWKVRFVVSKWAREVHQYAQHYPGDMGMDSLAACIDVESQLDRTDFDTPTFFCHGLPHGQWPNSACWLEHGDIQIVPVTEFNPEWQQICHEAETTYLGHDVERMNRSFVFDLAPDLYGLGKNKKKPFEHEEDTVHTLCLMGQEKYLLGDRATGLDPHEIESRSRPPVDPDLLDEWDSGLWSRR